MMWSGFLTRDGAGSAAWTGEYPLSAAVQHAGHGDGPVDRRRRARDGLAASLLAACQLATIAGRRAPGMTLLRMPVFTWSMLVTCLMVGRRASRRCVLAMALLLADRHGVDVYSGAGGATAYQHLFWFYGHPVVYVMFFPFLGAVARGGRDLLAAGACSATARRPLAARLHRAVDERVGPSHVHDRAGGQRLLLADLDDAGRPGGHRVPRDDRDDGRRRDRPAHADALRARLLRAVPRRRAERDLRRLAAAGLPRARLLLRRRALPLHAAGRQRLRALRRPSTTGGRRSPGACSVERPRARCTSGSSWSART